jgi:hypothetical protein
MGEEDGVQPRNEGAASATTRRLTYPRLGNLRVVKAGQSNLMLLGFLFVYLGCCAGVKPFFVQKACTLDLFLRVQIASTATINTSPSGDTMVLGACTFQSKF